MNTVEIYETGRKAEIPSSWDEMSPEQVRFVFKAFDRCVREGRSPLEFNIRVLYHLLGMRPKLKTMLNNSNPDRMAENIYALCERLLAFLFKDSDKTANLSFDSVRNPMPEIRLGLRRYFGPDDLLRDMTFGDFRRASSALNAFFSSQDESDLDECIAYLYRRRSRLPDRAGRRAACLDGGRLALEIRRVSRLSKWKKNLIMMWFSSCIGHLQAKTVYIDGEAVDMSALYAGGGDDNPGFAYNWNDMLIEIAKEQTVGNIDRVDEEPVFSVFALMWHNYKERKRYEKIREA